MNFCKREHQDYHIAILYTDKGTVEAFFCEKCNWILQTLNGQTEVKQTFGNRNSN